MVYRGRFGVPSYPALCKTKRIKKDTTEDIDTILVKNPKNHIFFLFINTLFIYEKISSKKPIKASIPL